MTTTPLAVNHFIAPAGDRSDSWINYVRNVMADCSRDDIADAYSNNTAYPISEYADPGKSGLLDWLNTSVDRLETDHRHIDTIHPRGLTLDGEPAMLVVASADHSADTASSEATAFALIAWLVDLRQWQDRQDFAA